MRPGAGLMKLAPAEPASKEGVGPGCKSFKLWQPEYFGTRRALVLIGAQTSEHRVPMPSSRLCSSAFAVSQPAAQPESEDLAPSLFL